MGQWSAFFGDGRASCRLAHGDKTLVTQGLVPVYVFVRVSHMCIYE